MWTQEDPGRTRRTQEDPEGPRRNQKDPGGPRRTQEEPGGPRRNQMVPNRPESPRLHTSNYFHPHTNDDSADMLMTSEVKRPSSAGSKRREAACAAEPELKAAEPAASDLCLDHQTADAITHHRDGALQRVGGGMEERMMDGGGGGGEGQMDVAAHQTRFAD